MALIDEIKGNQLAQVASQTAAPQTAAPQAQAAEGPSTLDQVANRVTNASISFLTGVPQIELDRLELENRQIDEQAQAMKVQRQAAASEAAEAQQLTSLFEIMNSPNATQAEKDRAGNMAAAIDPTLVENFFSAIGVRDEAKKVQVADRAARVAAQPDRRGQDTELLQQIVEGEAQGLDMSDTKNVLSMNDQERGVALSLAQTAALSPEERLSAAQQGEGLALEARRTVATEEGVEIRREQLAATQALSEATRVTDKTEQNLKTEEGLRKEVNTLLKDFFQVADANARVLAAGAEPTAAGDLALIFNYMKMLDPGSTVREGEFATAASSAGVPDRVRGLYNSIVNGQRMGEPQRADFLARAASLFEAAQGEASKTASAFERIATNAGVNVNNVLATFQARGGPSAEETSKRFTIVENPGGG